MNYNLNLHHDRVKNQFPRMQGASRWLFSIHGLCWLNSETSSRRNTQFRAIVGVFVNDFKSLLTSFAVSGVKVVRSLISFLLKRSAPIFYNRSLPAIEAMLSKEIERIVRAIDPNIDWIYHSRECPSSTLSYAGPLYSSLRGPYSPMKFWSHTCRQSSVGVTNC